MQKNNLNLLYLLQKVVLVIKDPWEECLPANYLQPLAVSMAHAWQ